MRKFLTRRSRGPRRKLAWEETYVRGSKVLPEGPGLDDLSAAWIRVPSGAYDPQIDEYEEDNETLVRTRVEATMQMSYVPNQIGVGIFRMAMGIIAWPSIFDDDSLPSDIPSPFFGEFPWVWRLSLNAPILNSGVTQEQSWYTGTHNGGDSLMESRAMRKLPSGVGLLIVIGYQTPITASGDLPAGYAAAGVRYLVKQP